MFRIYSYFWRFYAYVQLACGSIPRTWRGNPWFFRILHYTLILVVFVLLCIFSERLIPSASVNLPYQFLKRYWCGIFFLLIYVAIRFVIYLIGLLRESEGSEWPQIDQAWNAGLNGLEREGLDFHNLPLFLLLGSTPETEKRFFEGAQCAWNVVEPPIDQPAAVRFYANHECLVIACTGISAASQQAKRSGSSSSSASSELPVQPADSGNIHSGTMRGNQITQAAQMAASKSDSPAGEKTEAKRGLGGTLSNIAAMVQSTLGLSMMSQLDANAGSHGTIRPLSNADLHLHRMQMKYLATLLKRDRTYCPLNGVLQFIPFDWIQRRQQHTQLLRSVKNDVQSLSQVLHFQFPLTCDVVGLEDVAGFDAFIRRCHEVDSHAHLLRAGSGFPVGGILDDTGADYVSHLSTACFRDKAYEAFLADLDHPLNSKVYQFICELDNQVDNLKHLLTRMGDVDSQQVDNSHFCGCYLSAIGESVERQAFLQGVLVKLLQEQNYVAYTPRELATDRWMHQAAIAMFLLAVSLLGLAGYTGWVLMKTTTPAPQNLKVTSFPDSTTHSFMGHEQS